MLTRRHIVRATLVASAAGLACRPTSAQELATPKSRPILTIDGNLSHRNAPDSARFDLDMLMALPQGRFEGDTPWTNGKLTLTGPLASAVFDAAGASGSRLKILAVNDHMVDATMANFRGLGAILATHRDGRAMTPRDKGPIWVMYPFDRNTALRVEPYLNQCAWQVTKITVT